MTRQAVHAEEGASAPPHPGGAGLRARHRKAAEDERPTSAFINATGDDNQNTTG